MVSLECQRKYPFERLRPLQLTALAEFPSTVLALKAAIEIQTTAALINLEPSEIGNLQLRIGLHAGEVIADGANLLGDTVNLAARLQEHARVGGIVVSDAFRTLVGVRLDVDFEDLGSLALKNMGLERAYNVDWNRTHTASVKASIDKDGHLEWVGDEYPPGDPGQIAVCFVQKKTRRQYLKRVSSDADALKWFEEFKKRPDVLWGRRMGKLTPRVWIAKCVSGTRWVEPPETDLANDYFNN